MIGRTVIILVITAASLVVTAVIIGGAFPVSAVGAAVPIAYKLHRLHRQALGSGPHQTGSPCRSRQWLGSFFALSPPSGEPSSVLQEAYRARLFHLAAAAVGLRRVVEVWHTTGIAVIRSCIGAVEPPIVSRIAIIGNAACRMTVKDDALKRSVGRSPHAVAGGEACRA